VDDAARRAGAGGRVAELGGQEGIDGGRGEVRHNRWRWHHRRFAAETTGHAPTAGPCTTPDGLARCGPLFGRNRCDIETRGRDRTRRRVGRLLGGGSGRGGHKDVAAEKGIDRVLRCRRIPSVGRFDLWSGAQGDTWGGAGQRRRFRTTEHRRRIDRESFADDHAETLNGPGELELTLLHLVEAVKDFMPEVGRGQGRGANQIRIGSRSFRLATLHRHARPLHSAPATGFELIAGACTRSSTGTDCEA
jgi:hypothetical protein